MKALRLIISKRRYFAPALLFATLNVIFATWAIYIPHITQKLNISEGKLGLAVFFIALGTLSVVFFVPRIIKQMGLGKLMTFAVLAFCISFIFPFVVTTYSGLCISLYIAGVCAGLMDITMNTLVTELEKKDEVHFMSVSHGFFSLGGMVSAGIGTLLIPVITSPQVHIVFVAGLMIVINLFFIKEYYFVQTDKTTEEVKFRLKNMKPLIGLGIIGFLIMAGEGAIVDWSALYLEQVTLAAVTAAGLGYTCFNATMALGRFYGDALSFRYGSKSLMLASAIIGSLGFGLVLSGGTWIAIAGFGFVGLGFSVMVPELFRFGGKLSAVPSAESVSFISGVGFTGMLLGPVVLGFIAETFTLRSSFLALLLFTVTAGLVVLTLKKK